MSAILTLATMNSGGVVEAVDEVLRQIADNIADVNTPPDKMRELTLKLKIKPDESRTLININAVVAAKLQPQEAQTIPVILDKQDGRPTFFESFTDQNPHQMRIDGTDVASIRALKNENVTPFKAGKTAAN